MSCRRRLTNAQQWKQTSKRLLCVSLSFGWDYFKYEHGLLPAVISSFILLLLLFPVCTRWPRKIGFLQEKSSVGGIMTTITVTRSLVYI